MAHKHFSFLYKQTTRGVQTTSKLLQQQLPKVTSRKTQANIRPKQKVRCTQTMDESESDTSEKEEEEREEQQEEEEEEQEDDNECFDADKSADWTPDGKPVQADQTAYEITG